MNLPIISPRRKRDRWLLPRPSVLNLSPEGGYMHLLGSKSPSHSALGVLDSVPFLYLQTPVAEKLARLLMFALGNEILSGFYRHL